MVGPPVLVVGIGGAGCEALATVETLTEEEGIASSVSLVAIDSNSRTLRNIAPASAHKHHLAIDHNRLQDDCSSLAYLRDRYHLVPDAGTSRRRPLGRYLIDSAADSTDLLEYFGNTLEELARSVGESNDVPIFVWLINSLGGGTGSGALPLVASFVHECRTQVDRPIKIFGVGSLPRLNELEGQYRSPGGEPDHYANAYTALAELRTLMNLTGDTTYPISIEVNPTTSGLRTDSIAIEENPFSGYWLIGVREEDRLESGYFERANELVARLIYYITSTATLDWFEQGCLYSVSGISIEAPLEEFTEYTQIQDELPRLEDELSALHGRRESIRSAERLIQSVLEVGDEAPIDMRPDEDPPVDFSPELPLESVISACRQSAATVRVHQADPTEISDQVDDCIKELAGDVSDQLPDPAPTDLILRLLVVVFLLELIRNNLASHPLLQQISELQNRWLSDGERRSNLELPSQMSQTDVSVDEWYEEVLNQLRCLESDLQQRTDKSPMPGLFSTSGRRLSSLKRDLKRVERLVEEYHRSQSVEATLVEERTKVEEALRQARATLERKASETRTEREHVQQRWARRSQRLSRLEDTIGEMRLKKGTVYTPLDTIESGVHADRSLSSPNDTTLISLVDEGLLDLDTLIDTFERAITSLEEPVEDLAESSYGITASQLGVLATETTHDPLSQDVFSTHENTDSLRRELYYRFDDVHDIVAWSRGPSVYLLGCYRPVSLEYTSEFGTLHEYFIDEERDVSYLLGSVSDTDIPRRVAYPELFQS